MSIEKVKNSLEETRRTMERTKRLANKISEAAELIIESYKKGGKVVLFGNGGSAAQAQHIAAEFVNKFLFDRPALAAISLTTDTSNLTSIGNDAGYDKVFSRQVEALCNSGDVAIGFTTSDAIDEHSTNIYNGFKAARERKCKTIGMLSERGVKAKGLCDIPIMIPSSSTPRVQEAHIAVMHIICQIVEESLFSGGKGFEKEDTKKDFQTPDRGNGENSFQEHRVEKAMILVGGQGERLRPLTNEIPKPMVKVKGRPVLEYQLEALRKTGIKEVVMCGHYKFEKIKEHFGGEWKGLRIKYVDEPQPLGTGGAIKNGRELFGNEDFLMLQGDILTNMDFTKAIKYHKEKRSMCTLIMRNTDHPLDSNVFEMNGTGRITRFVGRGQDRIRTGHTGFYVMNSAMFDKIPDGASDIEKDTVSRIFEDGEVYGFLTGDYTMDIGTHDRLEKAEKDINEGVFKV